MAVQKNVLLTGATGFLGSHLLEVLLKTGYKIVILKRANSDTWRIRHLLVQVKAYDLDSESLDSIFQQERIDVVIHTACHYGRNGDSIGQIVETNLMFAVKLLEMSIRFNVATFVNTDSALPKYTNSYALSKKQFSEWLYLQSERIQVLNIRVEYIYGPNDARNSFTSWVIDQLAHDADQVSLTKGEQRRDFIYVDDVVTAYLLVLRKANTLSRYVSFDVATGTPITVRSFVEELKVIYEQYYGAGETILKFGALPYRDGEMMSADMDLSAIRELGWKPNVGLADGLGRIIRYFSSSSGISNDK